MVVIFVASDLWGIKDNIRLEFQGIPMTISHLTDRIEAAYQAEVIRLAPPDIDRRSIPRFVVECITMLVDDNKSMWVELFALKQLFDRCQLYAFQPANSFHSDSRGVLPPPREPIIGSAPAIPGCLEPLALPLLDVAHITFHRLDKEQRGKIRTAELKAALVMLGFTNPQLPPEVAGRNSLDFAAWMSFCHSHPQIAEALVRVGTVDPSSMYREPATMMTTERQLSPVRHHPGAAGLMMMPPQHGSAVSPRDLSPPRRSVNKSDKQRIAMERLMGGLSVSVTKRDRQSDVEQDSYAHLLSRSQQQQQQDNSSYAYATQQYSRRGGTPTRSTTPKKSSWRL